MPDWTLWVHAAPFRAHLRHLQASTGLSWRVLAGLAGVSPSAVLRLVEGRSGRPVRKINPEVARRLYALDEAAVRTARRTMVDSTVAAACLTLLRDQGWSIRQLSDQLQLSSGLVEAVIEGRRGTCSRLVDVRIRAGMAALTTDLPAVLFKADEILTAA